MQTNKLSDDVEENPDRVDPYFHQGKVACVMFTVLLIFSFLVIGIVAALNFKQNPQEDQNRGLLSDDITPIPFQHKGLCPDGWLLHENTCYLLKNVYMTWDSSKSSCHNLRAHLMVVKSEEEMEFISKVTQTGTDYWIGLKRERTGQWSWVNGDDYHSTPSFWGEKQPVYGGMDSCAQLTGSDTERRKRWHAVDCHSERYYICERKLEKESW